MKKLILSGLAAFMFSIGAAAQYKLASGTLPDGLQFVQLDQLQDTVRIYLKWTAPEDNYGFDVDDDIFVKSGNSFRKYRLLAAGNIPRTSDSAYAIAEKAGDTVNFVLDFEAFPLDGPFSIKEDAENDSKINIEDITVASDGSPLMDTGEFILSNPSCLKGQFAENGITYSFWNYKGMGLIATFANSNDDTHLFYIHLAFVNDSGKDFELDPSSVVVEHENKNGKRNGLKVFNATEYENRMKTEKFFQTAYKVASVVSIVESVGSAVTGGQLFSTNSLFHSPVLGYIDIIGGIAGVANGVVGVVNSDANMERLNNVFGQMKDKYLVPATIENGGAYGGYLSLNEKKKGHYLISVPVFDRVFTFSVEE